MYQYYIKKTGVVQGLCHKILLIMRLTTVLFIASLMQVSAATFGQKITMSRQYVPLRSLFKEIRKQSGFDFYYNGREIPADVKVSINVSGVSIEEALKYVLDGLSLSYEIKDKLVIITKKNAPSFMERLIAGIAAMDVRGVVVDSEKGEPMAGAIVKVKGTKKSSSTNSRGEFYLPDVDEAAVITISYLGYVTKELKAGKDMGQIKLEPATGELEEVAVVSTGYQSLPKERATGAFDIIGKEKIEKRVFTNVTEVLEGQTPGLSTYKGGIVVRGLSTFSTAIGSSPLVVIDGLPTERNIDDINVNDIETITILKDAAASSIYGVRAANGVIVITTKGGKTTNENKTSVQFTSDLRWKENPSLADYHYASTKEMMDYELATQQRDAIKANRSEKDNLNLNLKGIGQAGATSNSINYYTPLQIARMQLLNAELSQASYNAQLEKWAGMDYRQEYMDLVWNTPLRQSYNLSLNSSSKNQATFASLNYINDGQQNKYNENKYVKGYIKSTQTLNKWFSFDIGADIQYKRQANVSSVYENISLLEPYSMILDADGNKVYRDYVDITGMQGGLHVNPKVLNSIKGLPQFDPFSFNILDELNDNRTIENSYNVRAFTRLNFNLTKDLRLSSSGEYEFDKSKSEEFRSKDSYYYRFLRNKFAANSAVNAVIPVGGRMANIETGSNSWVWRNQLDFNKRIGNDHQVSATGGVELREIAYSIPTSSLYYGYDPIALTYTQLNNYDIYTVGYRNSYIYNNVTGLPGAVADGNAIKIADSQLYPTLTATTNRYIGIYGVAGYTYKEKYTITGSLRIDQTNLFGTDPKYRYRPLWSAGFKWNMAGEDFLKHTDWLNVLDFRASYGLTGNVDQTTTPFLVASLSNQSTYTAETIPYASITSAPNPMLRWEKTASYNAGFDYTLFNGLLNGKLDFYYKKSDDLLGSKEVNFTSGYTTQRVNAGSMSNKGIELNVASPWYRSKDLTLSSVVNISYNKNTVLQAYYNPTQASHLAISGYLVNGKPYDALYAYRYGGLTSGGTDYQNGVPMIYRADGTTMHHFQTNGTLLLDASASMKPEDVAYMGTKTPLVNASFTQNIRYKGFELSAMFLYYGGHKMYKPSFAYNVADGSEDWIAKAWRPDNTGSTIPKTVIYYEPGINVVNFGSLAGMYIRSTENVASGDFVRLRSVSLSYTVPAKIAGLLKLERLRVSGQINNPWIWSAAGRQYDAEVQSSASNTSSLSSWGMPTPTTYFLRLDVLF